MQAGRWVLGTGGMREGSPHGAPGVPPCQGWERSNGNRGWVGGDVPLAAPNAVPVEPLGAIRPIAGVLQGCTAPSCHPHPWVAAAGQGLGVIAAGGGRAAAVRRPARSVPVRPPEQHHVPQGALGGEGERSVGDEVTVGRGALKWRIERGGGEANNGKAVFHRVLQHASERRRYELTGCKTSRWPRC